jgi:hypothetical protein
MVSAKEMMKLKLRWGMDMEMGPMIDLKDA